MKKPLISKIDEKPKTQASIAAQEAELLVLQKSFQLPEYEKTEKPAKKVRNRTAPTKSDKLSASGAHKPLKSPRAKKSKKKLLQSAEVARGRDVVKSDGGGLQRASTMPYVRSKSPELANWTESRRPSYPVRTSRFLAAEHREPKPLADLSWEIVAPGESESSRELAQAQPAAPTRAVDSLDDAIIVSVHVPSQAAVKKVKLSPWSTVAAAKQEIVAVLQRSNLLPLLADDVKRLQLCVVPGASEVQWRAATVEQLPGAAVPLKQRDTLAAAGLKSMSRIALVAPARHKPSVAAPKPSGKPKKREKKRAPAGPTPRGKAPAPPPSLQQKKKKKGVLKTTRAVATEKTKTATKRVSFAPPQLPPAEEAVSERVSARAQKTFEAPQLPPVQEKVSEDDEIVEIEDLSEKNEESSSEFVNNSSSSSSSSSS